ncbi:putative Serine/threonine kinase, regulatory protein, partial [Clostridium tetanomorphum DSM 665]
MEYYKNIGSYGKAIDIYNKLSQLLDKELGIAPDEHTREIFNKVLDIMNEGKIGNNTGFVEFFISSDILSYNFVTYF